ncbi:FAD-binding oxidoreductase [Cohnella pontilimi]|uniref:FAD-binding oxidoreductase n=1 Tax=Cohnella pontilimi TaxID=2564100 RepID=A0A4U0FC96_9BACL|nr:FAD-binding oxidoreductase [Cohnella pontilimi]TJY42350.1 FAD-binding oxidoreductase [Cohnella pontilimi]
MEHIRSLWADTANTHEERPRLEESVTADVMIVGGGYTGLSTAYHLAQKRINCVVLEQHRVGWGASGRNAGMVLTGYKPSVFTIANKWGTAAAKELLDLSVDGIHLVKEIVQRHGIECSLSNCGNFDAAYKPSHYRSLYRNHAFMLKNFQYETYMVEKSDLKTEVDSELYHGGLVDPHSYSFHPLNYALGLADAAESLGAVIYEDTPVVSVKKQGPTFVATTPHGQVKAKHLVIGTNGYTSGLSKPLTRSVIPIGSYIVVTERLPREQAERLIPNNRMIADTKNFLYYFRRTPDDRILLGGRVDFNGEESEEIFQSVRSNLIEVFPELRHAKIEYRWGGMLGFTFDFFPHIGQLENGTHFALGYCGHGASISTLMGKLIALHVMEPGRSKNRLEQIPLKQVPFHGQRAIALNLATKYYRFLDRFF